MSNYSQILSNYSQNRKNKLAATGLYCACYRVPSMTSQALLGLVLILEFRSYVLLSSTADGFGRRQQARMYTSAV